MYELKQRHIQDLILIFLHVPQSGNNRIRFNVGLSPRFHLPVLIAILITPKPMKKNSYFLLSRMDCKCALYLNELELILLLHEQSAGPSVVLSWAHISLFMRNCRDFSSAPLFQYMTCFIHNKSHLPTLTTFSAHQTTPPHKRPPVPPFLVPPSLPRIQHSREWHRKHTFNYP